MIKIYEALEHARQKFRHTQFFSPIPEASVLKMENEMIQLYQAVSSILPNENRNIIQFFGSQLREGTSTVAREFASTLALTLGKNVLLLDADPDFPSHHLVFNITIENDIKGVVKDNMPLIDALYRVEESSLFVSVMSIKSPYNPDLFYSSKIDKVWEELTKRFDTVIIDSPPANISPIGFSICKTVDGVILVVEAERVRWPVIMSVKDRVMRNGGNILGVVFNKRRFYIPGWIYRLL